MSRILVSAQSESAALSRDLANLIDPGCRFDGSRYQPISNTFVLREEFELFCEKASRIQNPHEKALFTMAFMPYLQPFQDGNKRTSRLAMNIPLVKASLAPFSFTAVNKADYMFALLAFYERGRVDFLADVYVQAYQVSAEKYNELLRILGDGGTLATLAMGPEAGLDGEDLEPETGEPPSPST